jgi:hypothetical protein
MGVGARRSAADLASATDANPIESGQKESSPTERLKL